MSWETGSIPFTKADDLIRSLWKIKPNFLTKIFFVLFINLVVMSYSAQWLSTSDNSLYDIPHVHVHSQATTKTRMYNQKIKGMALIGLYAPFVAVFFPKFVIRFIFRKSRVRITEMYRHTITLLLLVWLIPITDIIDFKMLLYIKNIILLYNSLVRLIHLHDTYYHDIYCCI